MRKLFLCCLFGAFALFATAFAFASYAVRHPQSVAGRVLIHASQLTAAVNPLSGFASSISHEAEEEESDCCCDAPCQQTCCPSKCPTVSEPCETHVSAPIVIVEDETPLRVTPPAQQTIAPVQFTAPFQLETECPAHAGAAPCRLPYADGGIEQLPMPALAEEECENAEPGNSLFGAVKDMLRKAEDLFEKSPEPAPSDTNVPECREDGNYHHHYQGCPYTGRSYCPCPRK